MTLHAASMFFSSSKLIQSIEVEGSVAREVRGLQWFWHVKNAFAKYNHLICNPYY